MSLVMKVCERIQVLDYGRTIASGLPQEIANNPQVITAYLGTEATDDETAAQMPADDTVQDAQMTGRTQEEGN
jgi:branched-chain amino acid transport system ATP-binding protein